MFEVIDASDWPVGDTEPGGVGANVWVSHPDGSSWLFKPVRMHPGWREGEDWAEKIASRLARLVSVPSAKVEMAVRGGLHGCLSLDLKPSEPPGWEMHTGAVALHEVDPRVDPESRERTGHNFRNIQRVLAECQPPLGFSGPASFSAYDVLVGYLVFDAWIANMDRHEANWSILHSPRGQRYLAESYDHGASLASGLQDERRSLVLSGQPGVEYWVRRGRAHRFEGGEDVTLVAHALTALAGVQPGVRDFWLRQLGDVSDDEVEAVIGSTPGMSDVTCTFCLSLLRENRRRLLDG